MSEFGGLRKRKKTAHRKKHTHKNLGSAVLWLLDFPGESSPNFPCIALGQNKVILSNLMQMFSAVWVRASTMLE